MRQGKDKLATLRSRVNRFQTLPLAGKRIVITRPIAQTETLKRELKNRGARVIEIPAIRIEAPIDFAPIDQAVQEISAYDWMVFTSPNGVDFFFERLRKRIRNRTRALEKIKIAAVGPATSEALLRWGIRSDFVPSRFTTADLAGQMKLRLGSFAGKRLLLLRSQIAPIELTDAFQKEGAYVRQITAYRTLCPKSQIRNGFRMLEKESPDMMTFTSASCVTNFVNTVGPGRFRQAFRKTLIVSLGPATTAALTRNRIRVSRQAHPHTVKGLLKAILSLTGAKIK